MGLFNKWERMCPDSKNESAYREFWNAYFEKETEAYKKILGSKNPKIAGIISELAPNYNMNEEEFVGFLDGASESFTEELDYKSLEADSTLDIDFDFKKLLFNMHKAKADWLYKLPEWKGILTEEEMKEIKKAYSKSGTVIKEKTPSRNEPCPCGSGKKYKKCCGS